MRFGFGEEQEELRRVVRRFLEETSPLGEARRLMDTAEGFEPAVWKRLAQELALPGVHVPEAYGGQGFTFTELGIALEEMGRALLCSPYLGSAALAEPAGRWDADGVALEARRAAGGFTLHGEKSFVCDGAIADRLVVVGRLEGTRGVDGLGFFTLRGDAEGVTRRPLTTIDPTRKLARIEFSAARAEALGEPGAGAAAFAKTLDQAAAALSCEMVGGAQRLLDMSVEYAKTRVQFGRPIGSFQAIKHKLADMLLELELARSSAYYAAACAAEDDPELASVASLAKAQGSDAYLHIAAESIQIHGGLGFTWEQDVHLFFKRAKASEVWLGDPFFHREKLARSWGLS
jgi:alkylation response protein AidB-like acyl-CoA dehydrogenase